MSLFGKLKLVNSFFTSDPNLSSLDPEYHRGWFVRQAVIGKLFLHYTASESELDHILRRLLAYFYVTAEDEEQFKQEKAQIMDVIWPWLKPRLKHNKGLVKFMREYGVYSRYFVPLLKTVPGAWALCVAHGECPDIFGRIQKIPRSDTIYQFAQWDEMFAFARLRKEDVMPDLERAENALILGAGTLQEARQLQRFQMTCQKVLHSAPWLVAYDIDETLREYFAQVLDSSLRDYGVEFHYEDFYECFADSRNHGKYDVVCALGVASYYDKRLDWLLGNMKRMTNRDGVIKFDLQVLDGGSKLKKRFWRHTLVFDKILLGWKSNMTPKKSVADAIMCVERVCADVGLKVDYYKYDENNQIGVMFQCSRID